MNESTRAVINGGVWLAYKVRLQMLVTEETSESSLWRFFDSVTPTAVPMTATAAMNTRQALRAIHPFFDRFLGSVIILAVDVGRSTLEYGRWNARNADTAFRALVHRRAPIVLSMARATRRIS